jgi:hypothetical protein
LATKVVKYVDSGRGQHFIDKCERLVDIGAEWDALVEDSRGVCDFVSDYTPFEYLWRAIRQEFREFTPPQAFFLNRSQLSCFYTLYRPVIEHAKEHVRNPSLLPHFSKVENILANPESYYGNLEEYFTAS